MIEKKDTIKYLVIKWYLIKIVCTHKNKKNLQKEKNSDFTVEKLVDTTLTKWSVLTSWIVGDNTYLMMLQGHNINSVVRLPKKIYPWSSQEKTSDKPKLRDTVQNH